MFKAGIWTTFNEGLFALYMTGAAALGYEAPVAMEMLAKFEAEIPPAIEILSKEGVAVTEEDVAMALSDGIMYISRSGGSIAELPEVMNMEAESIMATGELLGGGTGNFMNAMYQFFATNQVSAQFVMDNADFFTTFFSWLGADLEQYDGVPGETVSVESFTLLDGTVIPPFSVSHAMPESVNLGTDIGSTGVYADEWFSGKLVGHDGYYVCYTLWGQYQHSGIQLYVIDGQACFSKSSLSWYKPGASRKYLFSEYKAPDGLLSSDLPAYIPLSDLSNLTIGDHTALSYIQNGMGYLLRSYDGVWNADLGSLTQIVEGDPFSGQIIGQDAKYDEAGNITDYGNVTVPNVFAPDYVAPGSYAEALNQMNATATTENPATVDSPSFGQGDTVIKDWVDQNQTPKPEPSEDASKDDFKVEDLETVFPYCIPWDLYYLLAQFAAEPQAPSFTWHFDFLQAGEHDFTVDLAQFEFVAQVVRTCEVVAFCVGLALLTRNLVRG